MILDHVQITVAPEDVAATLAFYEEVLGLERIPKTNSRHRREAPDQVTGGWFRLGHNQLHVGAEATSRELNLASKRHVCFVVDDLAAAELALRQKGLAIVADPDPAPNWKRFYVRDPGGNRVEVAQRQA